MFATNNTNLETSDILHIEHHMSQDTKSDVRSHTSSVDSYNNDIIGQKIQPEV